jgi:hypothetical protein
MPPREKPTYVITNLEEEYGPDYADYLAELEYRKHPSTLTDVIPELDPPGSEWDNHRGDVPPGFRIGKDVL